MPNLVFPILTHYFFFSFWFIIPFVHCLFWVLFFFPSLYFFGGCWLESFNSPTTTHTTFLWFCNYIHVKISCTSQFINFLFFKLKNYQSVWINKTLSLKNVSGFFTGWLQLHSSISKSKVNVFVLLSALFLFLPWLSFLSFYLKTYFCITHCSIVNTTINVLMNIFHQPCVRCHIRQTNTYWM